MRIVVGGETRKCGKTSLICSILRTFPEAGWAVAKVTPHWHEPSTQGGDTGRYLEAGAKVARLFEGGAEALPELKKWLAEYDNWIVESTTLAPHLECHCRLLVRSSESSPAKENAGTARFMPDALIGERRGDEGALPVFPLQGTGWREFLLEHWKAKQDAQEAAGILGAEESAN